MDLQLSWDSDWVTRYVIQMSVATVTDLELILHTLRCSSSLDDLVWIGGVFTYLQWPIISISNSLLCDPSRKSLSFLFTIGFCRTEVIILFCLLIYSRRWLWWTGCHFIIFFFSMALTPTHRESHPLGMGRAIQFNGSGMSLTLQVTPDNSFM